MGISGLHSFLEKKNAILYKNKLNCKYIAVDAMYVIYKFLYSDSEEVLFNILNQICKFLLNDIVPIYIIDGKPPDIKTEILAKRKNKKMKLLQELKNMNKNIKTNQNNPEFINKINKLKKKTKMLTPEFIEKFKKLLDILHIQYIVANGEADFLCCKLCNNNIVDACLSGDMDFLLLGCTNIINFQSRKKKKTIMQYNIKHILKILNFTKQQFFQFCSLLDNDYFNYQNKLNINIIYKNIYFYQSIQNWLLHENNPSIKNFLNKSLQNYHIIYSLYDNTATNYQIVKNYNIINISHLKHFFDNHIKETSYQYHRTTKLKKIIRKINIKINKRS